jgi:hypothetical protein
MRFDTKIAIVVRDDLAMWQRLNVACYTGNLSATDNDFDNRAAVAAVSTEALLSALACTPIAGSSTRSWTD